MAETLGNSDDRDFSTIMFFTDCLDAASTMVCCMKRGSTVRIGQVVLALVMSFFGIVVTMPTAVLAATVWPVDGAIADPFAPPEHDWEAGHRGVDLVGHVGDPVRTPAAGTITFSGMIVDRPVVVVSHGSYRSTFEPVLGIAPVGTVVTAGATIGLLKTGHDCKATGVNVACLHWGLKEGQRYLDPITLLNGSDVRLLSRSAVAVARARASDRAYTTSDAGSLSLPASGRISSAFGWRADPFTGVRTFHNGVDIAATCGSPIRAVLPGLVTLAKDAGPGGLRIVLDHGDVDGHHIVTAYSHAQEFSVAPGRVVAQGETIASVGSTGRSTGCHVHFQAFVDDALVDPLSIT